MALQYQFPWQQWLIVDALVSLLVVRDIIFRIRLLPRTSHNDTNYLSVLFSVSLPVFTTCRFALVYSLSHVIGCFVYFFIIFQQSTEVKALRLKTDKHSGRKCDQVTARKTERSSSFKMKSNQSCVSTQNAFQQTTPCCEGWYTIPAVMPQDITVVLAQWMRGCRHLRLSQSAPLTSR